MAGDHGLTPVFYALNPEKQVFEDTGRAKSIQLWLKKISSDEGEGPKITNALSCKLEGGGCGGCLSTAGGNFMMDFFNSAHGWQVQPVYQELTRWSPIAAPAGRISTSLIR